MTLRSLQVFKVILNFAECTEFENVSFGLALPELQDILNMLFCQTERIVDNVMETCRWRNGMVTDLVLLGGSSMLDTIRDSIRSKLMHSNLSVDDHVNPDQPVAVGAAAVARQALELKTNNCNRLDRFHLQDKTSYSIGIELEDGTF